MTYNQLLELITEQALEIKKLKGLVKQQANAVLEYYFQQLRVILENHGSTSFEIEAEIKAIKNKINNIYA